MSEIKLSICIPTYNREAYLRSALDRFLTHYKFDFPYEVVVSDNASTDNTTQVVEEYIAKGVPISYYRRETNGGSLANTICAFHQAVGEYAIYHADDDFLAPEGLMEAVRYMDANSDVSVCQAPWHFYDEVNDRDLYQFYTIDREMKFAQRSFVEVFQFLCERHIFPEIGLYRASALRSSWVPREFCFWAFSYLAHFLDQGAVAFLPKPFYRSVAVSKIAPNRQQAGNDDVMTSWDKYRGGLEYFLHIASKRGNLALTRESRLVFEELCRAFTLNRMSVAIRFWAQRKDFIKAYELYTRMSIGGMPNHPELAAVKDKLPLMVALQTLAYHATATAGITHLMLCGVADKKALEEMLYDLGLAAEIRVVSEPKVHNPDQLKKTVVFLADAARHQLFVGLGYKPNLIFSEQDLIRHVII